LAPLCSVEPPSPRVGCRYGGFGGFRASALFRARLASLGAALLNPIAFTLRVGCRFGGFGGFRCGATVSSRLAPHRSARFA
jgi:hypothetical protein